MTSAEPRSSRPTLQGYGRADRLPVALDALFVYGTLRFSDVLRTLIDRVPDREPAAAEGWRVAALPGRVYPGLVIGTATAHGYLMTGLTRDEWRVLDAFEGPVYELVRVDLRDGRHSWAYACIPGTDVDPDDWSAEDFDARHLAAFVEHCAAWRRHYEAS
ncbi:gamma-glutamylcyclotransferase family protein [Actinomadura roseirufa]|uniref:gamma-glutamylcyclotransferase family protein n=1 Tax=Actinomadura roseirufa TaxID=2094049 RepID=UPI0010415903|nr:gamma-glutamylcyclotransferase family protein [Actinomadura roseirufa]